MKAETKANIYNNLFINILFGTAFTIVGGLITNRRVDWHSFPIQTLVSILIGSVIGMVIPAGKLGAALARKVARPGTFLFKLVMYIVLLLIMLLLMCPILSLFIGCILQGAPVGAILPHMYSLFIPFFLMALVIVMFAGDYIMKLSRKCAGIVVQSSNGSA